MNKFEIGIYNSIIEPDDGGDLPDGSNLTVLEPVVVDRFENEHNISFLEELELEISYVRDLLYREIDPNNINYDQIMETRELLTKSLCILIAIKKLLYARNIAEKTDLQVKAQNMFRAYYAVAQETGEVGTAKTNEHRNFVEELIKNKQVFGPERELLGVNVEIDRHFYDIREDFRKILTEISGEIDENGRNIIALINGSGDTAHES